MYGNLNFRSDNNTIHDREVALGALEAKNEMEKEQPEVKMRHDPTAGIDLERVVADRIQEQCQQDGRRHNNDLPPGLEDFLPQDPRERERMIAEQHRIEQVIRRGGDPHAAAADPALGGVGAGPFGPIFMFHDHHHRDLDAAFGNLAGPWNNDRLLHRMGELLRLREDQRQRQRAIRRREQLALQEVRLHEIGLPGAPPDGAQQQQVGPAAPPPIRPRHFPMINHNMQPHNHPFVGVNHPNAHIFPPPPAHRQVAPRAVPPPPPAHPGFPRPAHVAIQPPALPLTFGPQAPDLNPNLIRFQVEPLPLRGLGQPGPHNPAAGQHARGPPPQPRRSPDLIQRELDLLFDN